MSDWQPDIYLQFQRERTQPSIDLAQRVELSSPQRVIDIGCGPGNSTQVLHSRWPQAHIIGLDSSQAMIAEAQAAFPQESYPQLSWIHQDASDSLTHLGSFDLVFSNAAIQWIPNQELLLPRLFDLLNPGGVLAVQVPCTLLMPIRIQLAQLAASPTWKTHFTNMASNHSIHTADFYYNTLSALTPQIDLWVTDYYHLMPSPASLVAWYTSTGLRPYLDCLEDETIRTAFLQDFESALTKVYPPQPNGTILFPFNRIFFMATRSA